ncbi:MAG: TIR domain-containing protein [Acidobacteriia bacterium]|nr:TIR domain-containing protein [Terriglobia bacterium]
MSTPLLEEVFKTSGVPTFTFVEPSEYTRLLVGLRTPGRGVVIEGPSGIGKTSAVETALKRLSVGGVVTKLSARRPTDVEYIEALPSLGGVGLVIIDDFHKLPNATRASLADYMKTLADDESKGTKVVVVGINKAGENLISFAHDLVNRIDVIPFETNPNDNVRQVVTRGADALNVDINVEDEIVTAAQGSFYLAQMLAREVCQRAGVLERQDSRKRVEVSFESVSADVWERLAQVFRARCEKFCRGTKIRKEGRAPYLHILRWLADGKEWTLSLREATRQHVEMRGSVSQVVDKQYLKDLIESDSDISDVIHYDGTSEQITVEDPQFIFFIRNIPWKQFALDLGFLGIEFENRYDFALSFAGEDRAIAEELFRQLQDAESEVFYDKNEQHRILAVDIEEYLRPIYQSEARFVIALLSQMYPKKIWTKIESDQFKERFKTGDAVPVWFSDTPAGMFDESRRVGGLTIDVSLPMNQEVERIVRILLKKLAEIRQPAAITPSQLSLPT